LPFIEEQSQQQKLNHRPPQRLQWAIYTFLFRPTGQPMSYDPNRSQVSENALATFLMNDLDPSLQSMPGIGEATEIRLQQHGVCTSFHLLGKYLMMVKETRQDTCDAMYHFLKDIGVDSYRSGIVHCLSEKVDIFIPNLYSEYLPPS